MSMEKLTIDEALQGIEYMIQKSWKNFTREEKIHSFTQVAYTWLMEYCTKEKEAE